MQELVNVTKKTKHPLIFAPLCDELSESESIRLLLQRKVVGCKLCDFVKSSSIEYEPLDNDGFLLDDTESKDE